MLKYNSLRKFINWLFFFNFSFLLKVSILLCMRIVFAQIKMLLRMRFGFSWPTKIRMEIWEGIVVCLSLPSGKIISWQNKCDCLDEKTVQFTIHDFWQRIWFIANVLLWVKRGKTKITITASCVDKKEKTKTVHQKDKKERFWLALRCTNARSRMRNRILNNNFIYNWE